MRTRCNNEVSAREYAGPIPLHAGIDVKHTLVCSHRMSGDVCLTIYFNSGGQNFQGFMLTNAQRINLGEFLLSHKPELWKDVEPR